mmetsp:Transcript_9604/g.30555  ORF Transcript_9604/g.30555 Transcript_9604/m.30555 type:complete len:415 (-) Transcript_9604:292-1536(-)
MRHQNERRCGVSLALRRERQSGGRSKLFAREPRRVLPTLSREDEVVRHTVPHVRVAVLILILVVVAHVQLNTSIAVRRKGRCDRCACREVQRLRHGAVLAEPELEVAGVVVQLQLDEADNLSVRILERRQDAALGRGRSGVDADCRHLVTAADRERLSVGGPGRHHEVEVVVVAVCLDRLADALALGVLHPRGEARSSARSDPLHAERGREALVDLALTVDHEPLACNGQVAKRDDAAAVIVPLAVAFAVAVGMAFAVAVAMAVAVVVAIAVMGDGLRVDQIPHKLRLAPILVLIGILDALTNVVAVHGLALDIDVQLILAVFSPVYDDSLPLLVQRPMRIARRRVAYKVVFAVTPELNSDVAVRVLEIPLCAFAVSKEQLLDRGQSPKVERLSPLLPFRLVKAVALQVLAFED